MDNRRYFIYVIRSKKQGKLYVGYTQDVARRLNEHNALKVTSTKGYAPYELIHSECFESEIVARKRERFLKTGKGRAVLRNIIPGTDALTVLSESS